MGKSLNILVSSIIIKVKGILSPKAISISFCIDLNGPYDTNYDKRLDPLFYISNAYRSP